MATPSDLVLAEEQAREYFCDIILGIEYRKRRQNNAMIALFGAIDVLRNAFFLENGHPPTPW